jgi:hypothetical protein
MTPLLAQMIVLQTISLMAGVMVAQFFIHRWWVGRLFYIVVLFLAGVSWGIVYKGLPA